MNGTNAPTAKRKLSFPPLYIGYIWGVISLALAIVVVAIQPEEVTSEEAGNIAEGILGLTGLIGFIYWLLCVHKIHKVLFQATGATYPISPGRAVGFHFIPFYNLYWIFKWPAEAIKFINVNDSSKKMSPALPGVLIFIGFIIGDGIGLIIMCAALSKMIKSIKTIVESTPVQGAA